MAPSTDWDEIKRLAADFQKAQLSSTAQRYENNNCHSCNQLFPSAFCEYILY